MDIREAEQGFDHPVIGDDTLPAMFEASAERNAGNVAQRYKGGIYDRSLVASGVVDAAPTGDYADLRYEETREVVRNLAAGFRDLGIEAGDRVGLFANTRMEWAQTDFAVLAAGGVVTTVYSGSSQTQTEYLLDDAGADGVVVENGDLLHKVLAVEDDLDLSFIVVMDEPADGSGAAGAVRDRDDVFTLGDLHERGAEAFDEETYQGWLDERHPEDLASLVYTSGTTGQPKGVQLTHWNFRSNVNQCFRRFGPRPDRDPDMPTTDTDTVALSFLPLAHVFERLSGHFLMLAVGATVAYAESPDTLREDFQLVKPTTFTSVPRVYEKLYAAVREQAGESPVSKRIFEWAVDVARDYERAENPGMLLSAQHGIADRLVYSSVREALGDNIDFFVSGGGSLSEDLCRLFHGMGIPILEGYGLTETAPVLSVNPIEDPKPGTIGPPVVDVETRIDESVGVVDDGTTSGQTGELLVRGPNVTDGYWEKPEATEEAFLEDEDGGEPWFRTGDVVEIREDGYITFRERAKQLMKLSTGKMVPPGPIEDAFAENELIEQVMVIGDARKFVSALVVPEFEAVRAWGESEGLDLPESDAELCGDDRVRDRIQSEVESINERFESHERIKQFRLVEEEFTPENDLLTPTMKKKRRKILDRWADEVDDLYE
ncbi:long-chain fatty acid--CoA ligase [Halolamina litorea]|uniref:AMP-dependent synthetase/ligase n=1 Tax=Halolamina litorea TaxID=1515593 RepID=A0ABD6BLS1_9EURY|nr:long-chain fatty acid--CoA ligase [Halolamina litorea]